MNDTPRETCETCYGLGRVDAVYAPCPDCELTAARAEIERLDTAGIHSCHKNCQRPNCVLRRELRAVTEQRDVASQCHKWCYEDRKRIIEELTAVTEQRDRLADLVKQFVGILDITEESDSGRLFHPTNITSCRAGDLQKIGELVEALRRASRTTDPNEL